MDLLGPKRSRFELLGTFLQILSDGPENMNQIFFKSGKTSWHVLYSIFPEMERKGLVIRNQKKEYSLTEKGRTFLNLYIPLRDFLEKLEKEGTEVETSLPV